VWWDLEGLTNIHLFAHIAEWTMGVLMTFGDGMLNGQEKIYIILVIIVDMIIIRLFVMVEFYLGKLPWSDEKNLV
jgi:hypothetical protein